MTAGSDMTERKIRIEQVRDFHPDHIFDCGQCFRWSREGDGSYTGIAGGKIANISFLPEKDGSGRLTLYNVTEEEYHSFWRTYLDLDRDYGKIKKRLMQNDEVMRQAVAYGHGIRLLQQEPWEALLCFILSQNNNIPRIRKCIESLCQNFGVYRGMYRGKAYYDYPSPETLASLSVEDLDPCRMGYRAKYLIGSAKKVVSDGIEALQAMAEEQASAEEAFDYIRGFPGVGPKVANCILLFGMGKYESFPVDVWIRKVMEQLYGLKHPKEISAFVQKQFHPYGGFAQQYLFYYIRGVEQL